MFSFFKPLNSILVSFGAVLLFLSLPSSAFAAAFGEVAPFISSSGVTTGWDFSGCVGYGASWNSERVYFGVYPDTSSVVNSSTHGGSLVCNDYEGVSLAGGFVNGTPITTDGDYWVAIFENTSQGGDFIYFSANRTAGVWSYTGTIDNTLTRIVSHEPETDDIVSSSTPVTVGGVVYINTDDFEDEMYLQMSFTNQTVENLGGSALDAWNSAFGVGEDIKLEITADGFSTVSTTTTFIGVGTTHATYKIVKPTFFSSLPLIGGLFNGDVLYTSTFDFVVGAKTAFDEALESNAAAVAALILTGTTTEPLLECNVFGGDDIRSCVISLVVPSSEILRNDFDMLYNGVLSKFPIGYITRFVTIVSSRSAVEPPAISYTFGSSSPTVLQGKNYTVQLFDHFDVLTTIRSDDGQNKNVWDITMPYFRTVVALAVLMVILHDLVGFRIDFSGGGEQQDLLTNKEHRLIEEAHADSMARNESEDEWEFRRRNRLL